MFFPFLRHFDNSDSPFLRQFSYGHISAKILKPNSPDKYFFPILQQFECSLFSDRIINPLIPLLWHLHFANISDNQIISIFVLRNLSTSLTQPWFLISDKNTLHSQIIRGPRLFIFRFFRTRIHAFFYKNGVFFAEPQIFLTFISFLSDMRLTLALSYVLKMIVSILRFVWNRLVSSKNSL